MQQHVYLAIKLNNIKRNNDIITVIIVIPYLISLQKVIYSATIFCVLTATIIESMLLHPYRAINDLEFKMNFGTHITGIKILRLLPKNQLVNYCRVYAWYLLIETAIYSMLGLYM